ncbi:FAD binding domain-containing protein [Phycicoccus flavus]|uniref:FAD binding domain-containing protein n=1 Tax=Phycicoccus flavus TaxID=2502783 RepID=UPI000FEB8A26|nr:FAD binding domain-containing protein [Phycicoccus flavus]NHA67104.1 FAD-binding molybdopterin dehydrogenase [Phycicoccus flavus]
MDLVEVSSWRRPAGREDLAPRPGEAVVAGGTWLFSQPQPGVTGLVDLLALGWPDHERRGDGGLRIGATCPVGALTGLPWAELGDPGWAALAAGAADALLMSFKVQRTATVGGNVCLALPAGAMTALLAALDATAEVWTAGGGTRHEPVAGLVRGPGRTSLAPGEVVRGFDVPAEALARRGALRRVSLTDHGRSAALVVGTRGADGVRLVVTASTPRPVVLHLPPWAGPDEAAAAASGVQEWFDDVHGAPDWRAAMTARLARQVLTDLGGPG